MLPQRKRTLSSHHTEAGHRKGDGRIRKELPSLDRDGEGPADTTPRVGTHRALPAPEVWRGNVRKTEPLLDERERIPHFLPREAYNGYDAVHMPRQGEGRSAEY
jgi:hypothetical protein